MIYCNDQGEKKLPCDSCYSFVYKHPIDWEQRRYEIAKEVFAFTLKYTASPKGDFNSGVAALTAIEYADTLIEKLKKGKEND